MTGYSFLMAVCHSMALCDCNVVTTLLGLGHVSSIEKR
jgi:hypothetical protein